jgi:hypothetical protein
VGNPSSSDINLQLDTFSLDQTIKPDGTVGAPAVGNTCPNNNVPNGVGGTKNGVCDPVKGFAFTPTTIQNFGTITNKRGRRIVEFAFKFYF